jgi:DNA-3-methyladenine glycosylase II
VLSLHQPEYRIEISPKKLSDTTADSRKAEDKHKQKANKSGKKSKKVSASTEIDSDKEVEPEADELPSLNGTLPDASASQRLERALSQPSQKDVSSVLPTTSTTEASVHETPLRLDKDATATPTTPGALGLPSMPPPLTPSVTQALSRTPDVPPPPLPAGLTVASLRSRLDGKKKTKYVRNQRL